MALVFRGHMAGVLSCSSEPAWHPGIFGATLEPYFSLCNKGPRFRPSEAAGRESRGGPHSPHQAMFILGPGNKDREKHTGSAETVTMHIPQDLGGIFQCFPSLMSPSTGLQRPLPPGAGLAGAVLPWVGSSSPHRHCPSLASDTDPFLPEPVSLYT